MGRLVRRRAGYALLLAGLFALAGCGDPTLRSEIGPTIDALSFEPPARSRATAGDGQRTGAPQGRPRPEVFLARGAVALVPRPPGVQRTPDGVQVNLDGAEVKEAVRVVLGDILRRPFTIDPRVSGTVTLSTAGPVAERDLLLVLETALRMVGAGLAESGPGFVVAPAEELVGRSELRPIGGSQPPLVAPGTGATVVPLRHISAQTAAQFVQPLLNKPEDIRVDPSSNLLLITGTAAERQAALDTLGLAGNAGDDARRPRYGRIKVERIQPMLEAIQPGLQPGVEQFIFGFKIPFEAIIVGGGAPGVELRAAAQEGDSAPVEASQQA